MLGSLQYSSVDLLTRMGNLMQEGFMGKLLRVSVKSDGTKVSNLEQRISNEIVAFFEAYGINVQSEEEGSTAQPGDNNIMVLDPGDGSDDLIAGQQRDPRVSLAMISLGFYTNELEMGTVCAPLLDPGEPMVMYSAMKGGRAYRHIGKGRSVCWINQEPTRGIVLVSERTEARIGEKLKRTGFVTMRCDGAVFKSSALVDNSLLGFYPPTSRWPLNHPIVGMASIGGMFHDFAGVVPIIEAAGGETSALNGEPVGPHTIGAVFANSSVTHQALLEAVAI